MDQELETICKMEAGGKELEGQGIKQVVLAPWQIEAQAGKGLEHLLGLELLHVVDVLKHVVVLDVQLLVVVIVLL